MVALFGETAEPLGGRVLLEEVCHREWAGEGLWPCLTFSPAALCSFYIDEIHFSACFTADTKPSTLSLNLEKQLNILT